MRLISSFSPNHDSLEGIRIYCDCDFLSLLFLDAEAFSDFIDLTKKCEVVVDDLTRFEFLRDVFALEQRKIKESFLANELFGLAVTHPTWQETSENAMNLSLVYAHNGSAGASFVDLHLAGKIAYFPESLLVTGNKKDFPNSVFDIVGVLNYLYIPNKGTETVRAYTILKFNNEKYETRRELLANIAH